MSEKVRLSCPDQLNIPDGLETVSHQTSGKDKINPQKIFDKVLEILN